MKCIGDRFLLVLSVPGRGMFGFQEQCYLGDLFPFWINIWRGDMCQNPLIHYCAITVMIHCDGWLAWPFCLTSFELPSEYSVTVITTTKINALNLRGNLIYWTYEKNLYIIMACRSSDKDDYTPYTHVP